MVNSVWKHLIMMGENNHMGYIASWSGGKDSSIMEYNQGFLKYLYFRWIVLIIIQILASILAIKA